MRKLVRVVPISIGMLVLLMVLSPALASSNGPTVKILGDNSTRINERVLSTYHFGPGKIHVRPGGMLTFTNTGTCSVLPDCTHTISIVDESQLPVNVTQVFACLFDFPGTVCAPISNAHFPQGPAGPVNPVANVTGEPSGFRGGNSFVINHGQTLDIGITAPTGTTIHYMCAIHPWMQGSIVVGQGGSDADE
jgi:plastocyanin